jgi:surface carbohydrate biosynthesis protein (TIGR04326 family)
MTASVSVWDYPDLPPDRTPQVYYWQSYDQGSTGVSVPRYLESHADRLREKYIAFVHDLGETRIGGKRIVEHLDVGDGFSFWWMTQLAEKSPFKSPRIVDCLRLLALEEILIERKPPELILDSVDRVLAHAIQRLCENLGIGFVWRRRREPGKRWSLRRLYDALPYPVQGLISLRHVAMRWPLRKLEAPRWFSGDDAIFFCSYFFNLDPDSSAEGRFYSRQWEGLPQFLQNSGKRTNWIHHFLSNPGMPDARTGLGWIRKFNHDAERQGYHSFLDSFLSLSLIVRALKSWLWLNIVSLRLREISGGFKPQGSEAWLWPLLRRDWKTSLTGPVALSNCLWVELFDSALGKLPHQKIGLYLWENQGWENALLRAWHRHGHGQIIGVPHATVVYWHLNNFDDRRTFATAQRCAKLLPDRLAVNGMMAHNAFLKTGYPAERFADVEALRFQYLLKFESGASKKTGTGQIRTGDSQVSWPAKILILGDFTYKRTLKMLACMEGALKLLNDGFSVMLKPHPVCPIERKDRPTLAFDLTYEPLAEIMDDFDFAFSSNTSSAGLDALLAGLPVAVFLDDQDFNHSPLRGAENVLFVSTASELAAALESRKSTGMPAAPEDFFWLDGRLPRWERLLSGAENNG